ncbi:MAG: spore coat associated protein CotJA [Acutalibacteraceae bacterium]|nr:spore coat associated protein CotJA [Acutalibacteraceae bacterium]
MIEGIYNFEKVNYKNESRKSTSELPANPVVAMAYVPFQNDDTVYSHEQGFVSGTMFPVLNKPFKGCVIKR